MPIALSMDCECCRMFLHHCKFCWDKNHNGKKHKDYAPPKYYGQPFNEEILLTELRFGRFPKIEPNKEKKYEEHIYGHNR